MGKACVNLIGIWKKGFSEPQWVITSLEAKEGQRIYFAHTKVEESFRDLKNLQDRLNILSKLMCELQTGVLTNFGRLATIHQLMGLSSSGEGKRILKARHGKWYPWADQMISMDK